MKIVETFPQKQTDREGSGDSFLSVIASLERINDRLERLENAIAQGPIKQEVLPDHPSLDKFSIAEAIADQIFAGAGKEKACTFEPNGKPCDHCSMCSSRGF